MKNVVFIPYIKRTKNQTHSSSIGHANRHSGYDYGIASWKNWCKKNDCEIYIMEDLLCSESEMLITWQRWQVLNILKHNEIEYDKVLVVDADTIIHADCPNFFEMVDDKFTTVLTDGDYEWVNRAINGYSKMFFNKDYCIPSYEFFQTGFVIINKKHKEFFDKVFEFYQSNSKMIIQSYETLLTGSDISLINCLRKEFDIDMKLLPREFSLMDLCRKNLLYIDNRCWWEDNLTSLYNSGWIYQFNAIPENNMNRDRAYWMKRIYEELY